MVCFSCRFKTAAVEDALANQKILDAVLESFEKERGVSL
jgi:hypothetical protein